MLISAFPKASLTKKTMKQIFSLLAWSFEILFSGVIPKKDLFGNHMENYRGRRVRPGVLYSITGDLEWFCQEFDWPYPSSNQLCPYCSADAMKEGGKHSFTDFRPNASWRGTILSNSQLKKTFQSHPIFKAPSVSILSVKLDWLHTVDLGVAAYLHGSLLYSIMEELPGRNRP